MDVYCLPKDVVGVVCDFLEEKGEKALWDTRLVSKLFYACHMRIKNVRGFEFGCLFWYEC